MNKIFDIQRYIFWCELRNLKPKEYKNNEIYLREELGERQYKIFIENQRAKITSYLFEVCNDK